MNARLLVLLVAASSCLEAPVLRVVPLTFAHQLPSVATAVAGTGLRLSVHSLEPLQEGVLVAWARTGQGLTALGPLAEETTLFPMVDALSLEEVLVTHELTTTPASPSPSLLFRGRPGEALALGGPGGPSAETMQAALVTATLENKQLKLHSTALPFVGSGFHYAVWVRHEGGEPMQLGKLGSSGADTFESTELLAEYDEVLLTLELDAGDDAAGTELMSGHTLPESALVQEKKEVHEH